MPFFARPPQRGDRRGAREFGTQFTAWARRTRAVQRAL